MNFTESTKRFRAFDPINKKFPFVGFDILGETTMFDLCNQYELAHNVKLKITQWTGLTDVEGNDIYEGDILAYEGMQHRGHCLVTFNQDFAQFQSNGLTLRGSINYALVIGNIYENANLLQNP